MCAFFRDCFCGLGLGLGLGLDTAGLGLGLGLETTGLGLGLGLETLVLTTRLVLEPQFWNSLASVLTQNAKDMIKTSLSCEQITTDRNLCLAA